jgi:hypothetical protein
LIRETIFLEASLEKYFFCVLRVTFAFLRLKNVGKSNRKDTKVRRKGRKVIFETAFNKIIRLKVKLVRFYLKKRDEITKQLRNPH